MAKALGEAEKVEARSAGRLKKSPEDGVPTRVVLMHFESPPGDDND